MRQGVVLPVHGILKVPVTKSELNCMARLTCYANYTLTCLINFNQLLTTHVYINSY